MKSVKYLISVIMILAVMSSSLMFASATANVSYDDVSEKITISSGSTVSPTDLFENFKALMPGDSTNQVITVENKKTNKVDTKIYLKSLGADKESTDLLKQLKLTVKESSSTLFEAPANETAGLTDWVLLGTLKPGGKVTLNVTITVPITVGNEFQQAAGKITWKFKTDELPIDTQKTPDGKHVCPICGKDMYPIIKQGEDGKYYIYYQCKEEKNHNKKEEEKIVDVENPCPKCGHEMKMITVKDKDGHEYLVYHCDHCDHEEDILCPICGGHMHFVKVTNPDGTTYEFIECLDEDSHHTEPKPAPKTGEDGTMLYIAIAVVVVAGATILACLFLSKKRSKKEENDA